MDTLSVGIIGIATRGYVEYWKNLAESIDSKLFLGHSVKLYLFTDQVATAKKIELSRCDISFFEIESLGWPDATLLRFKLIQERLSEMEEEVLMYLDADMLVHEDIADEIDLPELVNRIGLVQHPGYFRGSRKKMINLYAHNPVRFFQDFYRRINMGALGTWETDPKSVAYTPRKQRRNYVCGGTWLGGNEKFKLLVNQLATQVEEDRCNNVQAVWHDESHLNKWASSNEFTLLSPALCFDRSYVWLKDVNNLIEAIQKEDPEKMRQIHA